MKGGDNMKKCIIILMLSFLLLVSATPNLLHAQPVQNPTNGHWYELIILSGGLTWEQARDFAATFSSNGLPGHLATVTSSDENSFIEGIISGAGSDVKFWIGGYQLPNQTQTDVGWRWITGETWSFTDWGLIQSDEPNDWPTPGENNEQNYLTINQEVEDTFWGDEGSAATFGHLVVEYEPAAEREHSVPTMNEWGMIIFMALAGLGSVYYLRRKKITG